MPEVTPIQRRLLEGKRSTDRLCPEAFLALAERSVAECSARGMMVLELASAGFFSNALKHEEPKFPRQLGLPRSWGGPVVDNLSIRDLLLLTCATYAVTLLP
jgi:hypothetical protein